MPNHIQASRVNPALVERRRKSFADLWRAIELGPNSSVVGVIDVGAGNGLCTYLKYFTEFSHLYCFEPDESQIAHLLHELSLEGFSRKTIIPTALGQYSGNATLSVTKNSQNTSLLKPSSSFARRYRISGLEQVGSLDVNVNALDDFSFDHSSIVLKVDAQGADLDILRGASCLLKGKIDLVIVETCFTQIYEQQALFPDIMEFLSKFGFIFYGFLSKNHCSAKLINRYRIPSRERLIWTDSVFIKDPIENSSQGVSRDKVISLILSLIALEYFDLACELALKFTPELSNIFLHFVESEFSVDSDSLIADFNRAALSISADNAAWVACQFNNSFRSYGVPIYLPQK